MKKTSINSENGANEESKAASFGGSRYKRNFDNCKENGRKSKAFAILTAAGFVLLIVCLALFVAGTILQIKGMSLFAVFENDGGKDASPADTPSAAGSASPVPVPDGIVTVQSSGPSGSKSGYGTVLTADGFIVTCPDLISGAMNISVVFEDGRIVPAYAVGVDGSKCVSVIKADCNGLYPAKIGDSSVVREGDILYAPDFDANKLAECAFENVQPGIPTVGLSVEFSGRYGCPVFNKEYEVVAVICGADRAIPMSEALTSINSMINSGKAMLETDDASGSVDALGITVKPVTKELSDIYNIPTGCFVVSVSAVGSQIKKGDIIVAADNNTVSDASELSSVLSSSGKLSVYRTNRYIEIGY